MRACESVMGDMALHNSGPIRLAIIGCGSLGTAILKGLLNAKSTELRLIRISATTTSDQSANSLQASLQQHKQHGDVDIGLGTDNLEAIQSSDVVILACPPDKMKQVLTADGIRDALQRKVLVSVLAGALTTSIRETLYPRESATTDSCSIFRALPNLAVEMGASATAIEISKNPSDTVKIVDNLFRQLGDIIHVPASLMDASSVLCGSAPAFMALFMDGLVDGAIAAGVPRATANAMLKQVLLSSAALLQPDKAPSTLRESVCAMPGCTIKGSVALDQGGVRGASANAMRIAIEAAAGLG